MIELFVIRGPQMPWGDYGRILVSGMTSHRDRKGGLLQLERTGPFVPPIALSGIGDLVITDAFRMHLEASGLTGFSFRPVIKRHIVRIDWDQWDRENSEPAAYPKGGEPENYILKRRHDPALAAAIGDIWEVVLTHHAVVRREPIGPNSWEVRISLVGASWDGTDWFTADGVGYTYVSSRAKVWLETHAALWISFAPALVI